MQQKNGVHVYVQNTDKFKDIGISIRFMAPLRQGHCALRSLLAVMICDRCVAYPTKKAMSDAQDYLYGATLSAQTVGYGQAQVLEIRSKVIDPRYVKEPTLLDDVFAFLKEVITKPLFQEETLQESLTILKSKMQRMKDDPSQYVISKGLQIGGEGTPLAISSLGELKDLEHVSLEDVIEVHRQMLEESRIEIMVCGQVEQPQIEALVEQYLPFPPRMVEVPTHYIFDKEPLNQVITETRDIQQCSIFMLWQSNTDICDEDYYALRLATGMFGQYPTSLLFQEVREKRSLCYSIYANLISFDGAIGVTTGVEREHIEEAISLIKEQFDKIKHGDFEDALLEVTKTMMINSLRATKDHMNSLIAQMYQNAVLKQSYSIDDRIAMVKNITREQVQQVVAKCRYQMSFVLQGEEAA